MKEKETRLKRSNKLSEKGSKIEARKVTNKTKRREKDD